MLFSICRNISEVYLNKTVNCDLPTVVCARLHVVVFCRCVSEVQPVYSQFAEEEKSGGVVRMARVAYATSFLRQVCHFQQGSILRGGPIDLFLVPASAPRLV